MIKMIILQYVNTKSMSYFCSLKAWKFTKISLLILWLMEFFFIFSEGAACSSSISITSAITTNEVTVSGFSSTAAFNSIYVSSSKNFYNMYHPGTPDNCVVVKVNSSDSNVWITALVFYPVVKGFAVDSSEQNIYILSRISSPDVINLNTVDGSFVSAKTL